ncbi:proline-rich protein [Pholiota molesta]|nr:proline-rich protein [Pholiota molesta]
MDDTGPHEEPQQNGVSHTDTDDGAPRPAKQRQTSIDRDGQDMDDAGPHEEPHQNGTSHTDTDDRASRPAKQRQNSIDRDAQDMVIDSLRAQIQDLISQVSELNNKLVKSYDRVSDLEDNLHVASANVRSSSVKISQLELERTQHLSALNTGLLVEKSHVTSELTRLMEKATEEAAQRGQAESARIAIEKDLDDLSATLFGQANSMVAEARYDKHLSERKVEEAERALKSAEEAVQLMQSQMQTMQTEKEEAEKNMRDMEQIMGKGKWVATRNGTPAATLRLMSMHAPYQEYLSFVAHLRVLHPTSPQPPAMTTLLQLPFLHRLLTEDSEPTVRLDLAPSLNWLSRRSVLTAIHSGQLTIEPMSATTLFAESSTYPSTTTVAGMNSTHDNISCALCGVPIFPVNNDSRSPASYNAAQNSWSGSFFKKSLGNSLNITQPSSPTQANHRDSIGAYLNSQVFIFRMASLPTTSISSLPIPSLTKSASQSNSSYIPNSNTPSGSYNGTYANSQSAAPSANNQPTTIYPLCMSGWCLMRLRTTCTLWAFVRTGIVDKVWEEELPPLPPPPMVISVERSKSGDKPPIPPRKRGLWGIASAIGERAASWSGGEEEKLKKASSTAATTTTTTVTLSHPLPPAPPTHPAISQAHAPPSPRRMPPPLPPLNGDASKSHAVPPPLPRRNEGRNRSVAPHEKDTPTADQPEAAPVPPSSDAAVAPPPPAASAPALPAHVVASPASVPLPESRPATPSAAPSRATSPAIALPAGSPAPPIPRRAAARARPVPGGSRPSTPSNAMPASPELLESKAKEEVKVEETKVETAPKRSRLTDTNNSLSTLSTRTSSEGSDVFVDAPTPGEVEADAGQLEGVSEPAEKADETSQAQEDEEDKATVVDVPIGDKPTTLEKPSEPETGAEDSSVPLVAERITEEPVPATAVDEKTALDEADRVKKEEADEEDQKRREKDEKYKAGYVGDGTWEEKTWKELVRLREDMFWARVGGFRD